MELNPFLKSKSFYTILFMVAGLFIFTGIMGGLTYESWDDITIEQGLRGIYWNTPISNFHFFLIGISYVFAFLYAHLNVGLNYFGLSLILLNLCAFSIFIYILFKSVKHNRIITAIIFLFIAYSSVYIVSYTRVSILGTFSGLLLYAYAIIYEKSKKLKISLLSFGLFIMLYLYFLRPQGGFLAFVLFAPFLVWFITFNNIPKKGLLVFYIVLPVFIILFIDNVIINKIDPKPEYNHYRKYLDYGQAFEPTNKEQKMVLFVTAKWFLADKEIDKKLIGYMSLLGKADTQNMELFKQKKYASLSDRIFWQLKTRIFSPLVKSHPLIFGFTFLVLLSSLIFIKKNFRKVCLLYFFTVCYFSFVLYMFYYMKLENRVVIPLLTIMVFFLIIQFASFDFAVLSTRNKKTFYILTVSVLMVFVFFQFKSYAFDFGKSRKEAKRQLGALEKFNNIQNQDVVFLTFVSPGYNFYAYRQVEINRNKLQIPLIKWISFYPQNQTTFKKLTGSEKISDVVKWIAGNPDVASFYSCPKENENLRQIFEYYDLKVEFIPAKIMYDNGDGFYEIKIIN